MAGFRLRVRRPAVILTAPVVADLVYPADAAVGAVLSAVTVQDGATWTVIDPSGRIVKNGSNLEVGVALSGNGSFTIRVDHPFASAYADFDYLYTITSEVLFDSTKTNLTRRTISEAGLRTDPVVNGTGETGCAQVNALIPDYASGGGKFVWEVYINEPYLARFGVARASFNAVTASNFGTLGDTNSSIAYLPNPGTVKANDANVTTGQATGAGWYQVELDTTVDPSLMYVKKSGGSRQGPYSLATLTGGSGSWVPTWVDSQVDANAWHRMNAKAPWNVGTPTTDFLPLVATGSGSAEITVGSLSAIADAGAASYTTIKVLPGTYGELVLGLNEATTIEASDVADWPVFAGARFLGAGGGLTVRNLKFNAINGASGRSDVVSATASCNNLTIDDCEIYYAPWVATAPSAYATPNPLGVYVRDSTDVNVTNCEIHHVGSGFLGTTNSYITVDGNTIHDCYDGDAIQNVRCDHAYLDNNTIYNLKLIIDPLSHQDGIQVHTTGDSRQFIDINIRNNVMYRGPIGDNGPQPYQGVLVGNEGGWGFSGVTITGNKVYGSQFTAISVEDVDGAVITDNICQGFTDANAGFTFARCTNTMFKNNQSTSYPPEPSSANTYAGTGSAAYPGGNNTLLSYIAPNTSPPP